ncbi:hypothetical protein B484DRAFT_408233 [Ochromonadaceae sp. CCMP2298]|nr:hypothetical protein B484DRAFT_408233 [Ochromonadaceae sp. CCMP2298]
MLYAGAAFDSLTQQEQERWSRFVSVNSNGGVLHPVVHCHPISGRKSIYLHLGMTGAVLEVLHTEAEGAGKAEGAEGGGQQKTLRLLDEGEMQTFFNRYNEILNAGLTVGDTGGVGDGYSLSFDYEEGDMLFIDNFAVGHRAAPEAHESSQKQGLRILHRTTVAGMGPFEPPFGLPPGLDIEGPNPLGRGGAGGGGVWQGGGTGFVWKEGLRLQN